MLRDRPCFHGASEPVARALGPLVVTTLRIGGGPDGRLPLGGLLAATAKAPAPVPAARWAAGTRSAAQEGGSVRSAAGPG
ncbi:hypothetical protein ACWGBV_34500 [Streptomyces sp. NPDC055051]